MRNLESHGKGFVGSPMDGECGAEKVWGSSLDQLSRVLCLEYQRLKISMRNGNGKATATKNKDRQGIIWYNKTSARNDKAKLHLCLCKHLLDPPPVWGVRWEHRCCCLQNQTCHTSYNICHTSLHICYTFHISHTYHMPAWLEPELSSGRWPSSPPSSGSCSSQASSLLPGSVSRETYAHVTL